MVVNPRHKMVGEHNNLNDVKKSRKYGKKNITLYFFWDVSLNCQHIYKVMLQNTAEYFFA